MAGLTVAPAKPEILQSGEQERQLVQGYRAESAALPAALAPIQRERTQLEGEMQGITQAMPKPPQLQEVPQYQPRQIDSQEMMNFAGIAMALAALGTRAVRGDVTLALTAAGSAIKGFNEGNIQQTKLDIENFNTKMRGVVAQNTKMLDEYKLVLEDKKLTLAQKMQQYGILAHKYHDEIAMSSLKKGDLAFELERMDKLRNANNQTSLKLATMENTFQLRLMSASLQQELMKMRMEGAPLGPDALKSAASQAATGMPLTQVMPGYGQAGTQRREIVRQAAVQQIMTETGVDAVVAGAELARRQLDFAGIKGSVGQLEKMLGGTRQAVAQLDFNIAAAKAEMKKLGSTDISPILNAIARGEQRWMGEPAYSSLFYYLSATGQESARILSGGVASVAQLHAGAQEEARKWVNINMTPASFDAVSDAMAAEGRARIGTFEQAIAAQRAGLGRSGSAPAAAGGAALSPAEQQELDALRKRFGR